jgi:hypothetical protein
MALYVIHVYRLGRRARTRNSEQIVPAGSSLVSSTVYPAASLLAVLTIARAGTMLAIARRILHDENDSNAF